MSLRRDWRATGITKVAAERVFEAMLDSMAAALEEGEAIQLRHFGGFVAHTRKQRRGRDPKTGAIVVIAPSKTAKFLPSRELKALLNPAAWRRANGVRVS